MIPADPIDNIDLKIFKFCTADLSEYNSFDDYYTVFQWMVAGQNIISPDLKVINDKLISFKKFKNIQGSLPITTPSITYHNFTSRKIF